MIKNKSNFPSGLKWDKYLTINGKYGKIFFKRTVGYLGTFLTFKPALILKNRLNLTIYPLGMYST